MKKVPLTLNNIALCDQTFFRNAEQLIPELQSRQWIFLDGESIHIPRASKFLSDGIAAELFKLL